jgi:hypothetical protein
VRAGTVVEPSSSILAPIQQVMPSSRLVADKRNRPSSVAIRTFAKTGSVLRGDTARETILSPRARFSCSTDTFMIAVLSLVGVRIVDRHISLFSRSMNGGKEKNWFKNKFLAQLYFTTNF